MPEEKPEEKKILWIGRIRTTEIVGLRLSNYSPLDRILQKKHYPLGNIKISMDHIEVCMYFLRCAKAVRGSINIYHICSPAQVRVNTPSTHIDRTASLIPTQMSKSKTYLSSRLNINNLNTSALSWSRIHGITQCTVHSDQTWCTAPLPSLRHDRAHAKPLRACGAGVAVTWRGRAGPRGW